MSHDVRQYWREVRAIQATLADFVWLSPVEAASRIIRKTAPGADDATVPVVEVTSEMAARLLQRNSHRLATEAEIAAHRAAGEAAKRQARREELRRSGSALVVLGAEGDRPGTDEE